MFERLCAAMERPDLLEAFGEQSVRLSNRIEVIAEVEAWTQSRDRDGIIQACIKFEVPSGPINSIADIFSDPHFKARENIITVPVPGIGEIQVPGVFPKLSETPGKVRSLGPKLGNANEAIYHGELGISAKDLAYFKSKKII